MIDSGQSAKGRELVTISVPVLNEEDNIDRLLQRLRAVAAENSDFDFEFLFTDNASTDDTFAKLAEWAEREPRLRALRFSRNFGFQRSILVNFLHARGSAAIQLDADLQDPPELIGLFLEKWRAGYKVVYGIRRRRTESLLLRTARKLHYRLTSALSDVDVPVDAGDFRLVDRVIIEHLRKFEDRTPYLRGAVASIGFPQIGIPYDRAERVSGRSKFGFARLVALSLDGLCSLSTRPLQYITMFGFALFFIATTLAVTYLVTYFFTSTPFPRGTATLILLVLLSIGINAFFVGVLGEYIGRIYNTVRGGPMAIVADRIESAAGVGQRATEQALAPDMVDDPRAAARQ